MVLVSTSRIDVPGHRFADGFGVRHIVLVDFHVGFHEPQGHELYRVSEFLEFPRPRDRSPSPHRAPPDPDVTPAARDGYRGVAHAFWRPVEIHRHTKIFDTHQHEWGPRQETVDYVSTGNPVGGRCRPCHPRGASRIVFTTFVISPWARMAVVSAVTPASSPCRGASPSTCCASMESAILALPYTTMLSTSTDCWPIKASSIEQPWSVQRPRFRLPDQLLVIGLGFAILAVEIDS